MFAQFSAEDKAVILVFVTAILAPTWMAWWNARVARKQVTPNGGSSLKDQVTSINTKIDTLVAVQELHTVQIATIREDQAKIPKQVTQEREDAA